MSPKICLHHCDSDFVSARVHVRVCVCFVLKSGYDKTCCVTTHAAAPENDMSQTCPFTGTLCELSKSACLLRESHHLHPTR